MYEVLISHEAEKYYKKIDNNTKLKINKCIDNLKINPLFGRHIKRLHGELKGKYRYEIGSLRIVYKVNIPGKIIEILAIKNRGKIYK